MHKRILHSIYIEPYIYFAWKPVWQITSGTLSIFMRHAFILVYMRIDRKAL